MHEQPRIPEEHLRACFQEQYDLIPVTLDFLPLGLDYNAGVYRVVSEQGTPYLLKVKLSQLPVFVQYESHMSTKWAHPTF
jgi:spectinomycin phosphotransferase